MRQVTGFGRSGRRGRGFDARGFDACGASAVGRSVSPSSHVFVAETLDHMRRRTPQNRAPVRAGSAQRRGGAISEARPDNGGRQVAERVGDAHRAPWIRLTGETW
jgi:hypothetical protein